eukprot:tig00000215_g18670.t1
MPGWKVEDVSVDLAFASVLTRNLYTDDEQEQKRALDRIRKLSREGKKDELGKAGCIRWLVEALSNEALTERMLEKVTATLASLAVHPENKDRVRELGGIPHLVWMLSRENVSLQMYAATCLYNLVCNDSENKEKARDQSAIPAAVDLLAIDNKPLLEIASSLIFTLSFDDDGKKEIIETERALTSLVMLMNSDNAACAVNATGVFWNIASHSDTDLHELMRQEGLLIEVVRKVASGGCSDIVLKNLTGALWNFAAIEENRASLLECGAVPALISVARDGTLGELPRKNATGALWNLAQFGPAKKVVREARGVPALVALLGAAEPALQRVASCALWSLAVDDGESKDAIREAGAIPKLVALLASADDEVPEKAAGALLSLSVKDENKRAVREAGGVEALGRVLASAPNPKVKETALVALSNLAIDPENKQAVQAAAGPVLGDLAEQTKHAELAKRARALSDLLRAPSRAVGPKSSTEMAQSAEAPARKDESQALGCVRVISSRVAPAKSAPPLAVRSVGGLKVEAAAGGEASARPLSPLPRREAPADWGLAELHITDNLIEHEGAVRTMHSSGDWLFSGSDDGTVKSWNLQTSECVASLAGHKNWVCSLAADEADYRLYSGSYDSTIRVWDLKSLECLETVSGHDKPVLSLALAGERLLLSGSADKTLKVWNFGTNDCTTLNDHKEAVTTVKVWEKQFITGSRDCHIRIFDLETLRVVTEAKAHQEWVHYLLLVGDRLFSGSDDNTIKVWDPKGDLKKPIQTLKGHKNGVRSLATGGGALFSGSVDDTIAQWDLSSLQLLRTLRLPSTLKPKNEDRPEFSQQQAVLSLAVSGPRLLSGLYDSTIKIWTDAPAAPDSRPTPA